VHPAVLPAVVWVLLVAEQLTLRPPAMPVAVVGAGVMALALAGRTTRPLLPVVVVPLTLAAEALLGVSTAETSMPILPVFWVVFLAFSALGGRRRLVGLAAVAVGMAVGMLFDGGHADVGNLVHSALFTVALCVPAAVTGGYVSTRHRYTRAVEERAQALEAQHAAETAAALAQERLRIARELHDVIAHSVGLMGVQAGAVRRRLQPEQEALRDMLLSVEGTGRSAIEELRHVLGVLRADGPAPGEGTAPQPTLAELPDLVAAARAAGQEVCLVVSGSASRGGGAEVSGYRIVQEALTNARKHAPGSAVEVTVHYAPDAIRIGARNPLPAALSGEPTQGTGHGLLGMRERVQAFGGSLEVDRDGGWFAVRAVFPLSPVERGVRVTA
jgi:signal transduction histidine kinase